MPKQRIELSLDSEIVELLRMASIKKYRNLRSVSRLIEDLAIEMHPIDIEAIKAEREAYRNKYDEMMVLHRKDPYINGFDPSSWQKHFRCNTCDAQFRTVHNDAKFCPMCRSDKVAQTKLDI